MWPQLSRSLSTLQTYAHEHFEALQCAALLLGGAFAAKRARSVLEDVVSAQTLTRRMQIEMIEMHKLLSLHYVDDPERVEAAYFAEIDVSDPFIEDICLMTDQLTDILQNLKFDPSEPLAEYLAAA